MDVLRFKQPQITIFSLRVFPLVYLGTLYTKHPKGLQVACEEACRLSARLLINGIRVYCPIAHSHPIAHIGGINPIDHSFWKAHNEPFIRASSALVIAEMEGWRESDGIKDEIVAFEHDGKPIYYINPNSLAVRQ